MIKLPDAIVVYPQKVHKPNYLLCWIPAKYYSQVAKTKEARETLFQYYPNGIEVELSADGLKEAGIKLSRTPNQLGQAYTELFGEGLIPESGMVEVANLDSYIGQKQGRSKKEAVAELAENKNVIPMLAANNLMRKIASPPPMTEGEEAKQVYQRLSAPRNLSEQEE
jgi:hypothetical protein